MVRVLAYASIAVSFCAAAPPNDRDELLQDLGVWKATHGQKAKAEGLLPNMINLNETELILGRLRNAKNEVKKLKAENPQAEFDHLGPFALLTTQEFADRVAKSFNIEAGNNGKRALRAADVEASEAIPTTMDWSTSTCVNAIKNQGQCGSCWAFAATSALESAHCIKTGTLLNLSEQQLVSCDTKSSGCAGGYDLYALQNVLANGQCLSVNYPYTSGSNGSSIVSGGSGEVNLKNRVANQPVSVHVYAGNTAFQYYKSGILTSCKKGTSDHAVVALGYGSSNGVNYFKIRNSWGISWGELGYIRLANGGSTTSIGTCNVAQVTYFPSLT
uniref:Secreted protein n=1 Tax=Thraustotheca clavata TaxID=74557 RepID=A0A0A7CMC9_9STRA|nr:secreted protein [Thraustotheca clavata]